MKKLFFAFCATTLLIVALSSFTKKAVLTKTTKANGDIHNVDGRLIGKWMWTKGSSGVYYDNNGTYKGSAYGFATQYNIEADGMGTCFSHIHSTIGAGSSLEVNISYNGFYESDDQGHLGFFPTSGTYQSSSGTNRPLRPDELWDVKANKGKCFLSQKLVITKQGERECFKVTANDGTVDTFFKMK